MDTGIIHRLRLSLSALISLLLLFARLYGIENASGEDADGPPLQKRANQLHPLDTERIE